MMGVLWAQLSRSGAAQPGEGPQPASSAGPERDRNSRRPEILMNEKPPQCGNDSAEFERTRRPS